MGDGEAVLQAMRAAGVFRHVAADGAHRLRRGIGRIEVAVCRDALRNMRIDDARLNDHVAVGDVHFKDAIHARQADDNTARGRQRASAEAGARAAADKRNPMPRADAHHGLNFRGAARQHYRAGKHAEIRQAVAFIGLQLALPGNQAVRSDGGLEFGNVGDREHRRNQLTR